MGDIFEDENEPTMTMKEYIEGVEAQELEADLVLGGDEGNECTYSQGYLKRQAVFSCLTCAPAGNAGVCTACCLNCHDGHEVVELWTRRRFRCDCGNSKFGGICCKLLPDKEPENKDNAYNQNYKGLYCTCHRPYPDPDEEDQVEMIQCCICEDWFHENHLCFEPTDQIPRDEEGEPVYEDFVCQDCAERCSFLPFYREIILIPSTLKGIAASNELVKESMKVETNDKANTKNETSAAVVTCGEMLVPAESLVLSSNISRNGNQVMQNGLLTNYTMDDDDRRVQASSVGHDAAKVISGIASNIASGLCGNKIKSAEGLAYANQVAPYCRSNERSSTSEDLNNSGQSIAKSSLLSDQVTEGTKIQGKESVCKPSTDAAINELVKGSMQLETNGKDDAKNETSEAIATCGEVLVPVEPLVSNDISKYGSQVMQPDSPTKYAVNDDDQVVQPNSVCHNAVNVMSRAAPSIASGLCGSETKPSEGVTNASQVMECCRSNAGSSTWKDLNNSGKLITKSSLPLDEVAKGTKVQDNNSACKLSVDLDVPLFALESKRSMFLAKNWRDLLCRCRNCLDLYNTKGVTFLLDKDDTLEEYEKIAKQKREEKLHQQEGVEQRFLQNLGHIQQIELLTGISDMKNELRSYLESFDNTRAVTSADIQKFFQNLERERKRQRLV